MTTDFTRRGLAAMMIAYGLALFALFLPLGAELLVGGAANLVLLVALFLLRRGADQVGPRQRAKITVVLVVTAGILLTAKIAGNLVLDGRLDFETARNSVAVLGIAGLWLAVVPLIATTPYAKRPAQAAFSLAIAFQFFLTIYVVDEFDGLLLGSVTQESYDAVINLWTGASALLCLVGVAGAHRAWHKRFEAQLGEVTYAHHAETSVVPPPPREGPPIITRTADDSAPTLSQILEERFIRGEISEATYLDLRQKHR